MYFFKVTSSSEVMEYMFIAQKYKIAPHLREPGGFAYEYFNNWIVKNRIPKDVLLKRQAMLRIAINNYEQTKKPKHLIIMRLLAYNYKDPCKFDEEL